MCARVCVFWGVVCVYVFMDVFVCLYLVRAFERNH